MTTHTVRSRRTRRALLDTARAVFTTQGYTATTTEEIVRRAGVTRGALYYHFRDKATVFEAVFDEVRGAHIQALRTAMATAEGDAWQRLMTWVELTLERVLDPRVQRIVYINGPAVLEWSSEQRRAPAIALVREIVAPLMDAGLIERLPLDALARQLWALFFNAAVDIVQAEEGSFMLLILLCVAYVLCFPAAAIAQPQHALESPAHGAALSGLGFISGWKCNPGTITVSVPIQGAPHTFPTTSGLPRNDTASACNGQNANGFITQINWNWLGTGEHTAIAYDDGVEFARSTFTVTQLDTEQDFVPDLEATCTVPDFPIEGTHAAFAWNTSTQHLELAEVGPDVIVPTSMRYDGNWRIVFTKRDFEESCACADGLTFDISLEAGKTWMPGFDCVAGIEGYFSLLVSPAGQLEGSWYYLYEDHGFEVDEDGLTWDSLGSLDGFMNHAEGFGRGNWLHVNGCYGEWYAERWEGDSAS